MNSINNNNICYCDHDLRQLAYCNSYDSMKINICIDNQQALDDCLCGNGIIYKQNGACINNQIIPLCNYETNTQFDCWCGRKIIKANQGICHVDNNIIKCPESIPSNDICLCGSTMNINSGVCKNDIIIPYCPYYGVD